MSPGRASTGVARTALAFARLHTARSGGAVVDGIREAELEWEAGRDGESEWEARDGEYEDEQFLGGILKGLGSALGLGEGEYEYEARDAEFEWEARDGEF